MSGAAERLEISKKQDGLIEAVGRIETRQKSRRLGDDFVKLISGDDHVLAAQRRREFINTMRNPDWRPEEGYASLNRPSHDPTEDSIEPQLEEVIISSLSFPTIEDRETVIPSAYESTYQWIFQTNPDHVDSESKWDSFSQWLSNESSPLYWITGKPGSGKSTLMKFIINHPQFRTHLQTWPGKLPIVSAAFYFWSGGTEMQKSQKGFLRTLLYQCLKQEPSLVPIVCPKRWALGKLFGHSATFSGLNDDGDKWEWDELLAVMNRLISCTQQRIRLALFIDGLDEFDGEPQKLIDLVNSLRTALGVKICVSSRPWNVFVDSFGREPSLRLEFLTRCDIRRVIEGNFESSRGFHDLSEAFPHEASQFMTAIADKAEGVFLWVTLVMKSLLEGIMEGDKISDLQARLKDLPSDLEDLFQKIRNSIDPRFRVNSSALLQILTAAIIPIGLFTMWLADEEGWLEKDVHAMSASARSSVTESMRRRLNSRTRGLLEASPSGGRVDFLHRTVRDWVLKPEIWAGILAQTGDDFDPDVALCKAYTIEFPREDLRTLTRMVFWDEILLCMAHAARARDTAENGSKLVQILDRLDSKASRIALSNKTDDGDGLKVYHGTLIGMNLQSYQRIPHWSTTEGKDIPHNCFLGLAAQCGVLPYVKAKLEAEADLNEGPDSLSVLESAIHGHRHYNNMGFNDSLIPDDEQRRTEMVQLLIKHRATPGRRGRNELTSPKGTRRDRLFGFISKIFQKT